MSLNGKIALVTGAATGIGASLAKALALEGALVVGADLAWGDSEQAPDVEQLQCDVSDPSDVERCVANIEARHGAVDILALSALAVIPALAGMWAGQGDRAVIARQIPAVISGAFLDLAHRRLSPQIDNRTFDHDSVIAVVTVITAQLVGELATAINRPTGAEGADGQTDRN
jgi:NAD(P)-dependent dehydrogenase (short-subunit alcohol dehydrogenase family)